MFHEHETIEDMEKNVSGAKLTYEGVADLTPEQTSLESVTNNVAPQNPRVSSTTCQPVEVYGNRVSQYRSHMSRIPRLIPAYLIHKYTK